MRGHSWQTHHFLRSGCYGDMQDSWHCLRLGVWAGCCLAGFWLLQGEFLSPPGWISAPTGLHFRRAFFQRGVLWSTQAMFTAEQAAAVVLFKESMPFLKSDCFRRDKTDNIRQTLTTFVTPNNVYG